MTADVVKVVHRCGQRLGPYKINDGWIRPVRDRRMSDGTPMLSSMRSFALLMTGQPVALRGIRTGTGIHFESPHTIRVVCRHCGVDDELSQPLALEYRDGVAYV